jgi:aprataxin
LQSLYREDADLITLWQRASLRQGEFEDLLKEDLRSWRTGEKYSTMPKLKIHLEQEWERETRKGREVLAKRRREESDEDKDEAFQPSAAKKAKSRESDTDDA